MRKDRKIVVVVAIGLGLVVAIGFIAHRAWVRPRIVFIPAQPKPAMVTPILPGTVPAEASNILPLACFRPQIAVNGKSYRFPPLPPQVGIRVAVPAEAVIAMHFAFPPHTVLREEAADGGSLSGGGPIQAQQADDQGNIGLTYHLGARPGLYRVFLAAGGRRQQVDFWVGPPLPLRSAIPTNLTTQ